MNGYLIIAIVAIGIVICSSFVANVQLFSGDKDSKVCKMSEAISCVSFGIMLVFLVIGISLNISAKNDYKKLEMEMQYANSLDCTVETEKFEHDYIVARTKYSLREMRVSIDEHGVFSLYYGIKEELEQGELGNEGD